MTEELAPYGPDVLARQSWDQYFLDLACKIAERSTCLRRKVGAVAVRDKRILATGYNGAPSGLEHCLERGCYRQLHNIPSGQRHELCRAVHAEQNVLCQAARFGIELEGCEIYIHGGSPCAMCAKMLINAKTQRIVYQGSYPDQMAMEMLQGAGVIIHEG